LACILLVASPLAAQSPNPPAPDEPGPTKPLVMDKLEVKVSADQAAAAFQAKQQSDTPADVVTGAAVQSPNAQSASDLLKGVPGVSVTPAADGASNISIRGLDSRFVRVTVDGQRQGNSGIFNGGTALDSIPPDVIKSLEVTKAVTPDMDADAIGGVINISTLDNSESSKAFVNARSLLTFNSMGSRFGSRASVSVGEPFTLGASQPNAGLVATVAYDAATRPRENVETLGEWPTIVSPGPAPYTGQPVPALTQFKLEDTVDHNRRLGAMLNANAHWGNTSAYVKTNFTRDARDRTRNRMEFDVSEGTPLALAPDDATFAGVYPDRRASQQGSHRDSGTLSVGTRTTLSRLELTSNLGATVTDDREPHTIESVFTSTIPYIVRYDTHPDPAFPQIFFTDPANPGSPYVNDASHYDFNSLTVSRNEGTDIGASGSLDAKLNLSDAEQPNYLKFGVKAQERHRSVDQDRVLYDPVDGTTPLSLVGLTNASSVTFRNGGYVYGPIPEAGAVAATVVADPGRFAINSPESLAGSTAGDYRARETIWAAYGMGKVAWGKFTLLAGVRVEGTQYSTSADQVTFAADGSLQAITPITSGRSYVNFFPGVYLRWDPEPGLLLRSSISHTITRPAYGTLAPTETLNFEEMRISAGNPALKPYRATAYDLSADGYDARFGLASIGLFYKQIDDFIDDSERSVTIAGLGTFIESQSVNGQAAQVWGVETSWQSIALVLPGRLGTATIEASYTFTRSQARLLDRPSLVPLPDQADDVGNLTFHDEIGKLSCDVSPRYTGTSLDDLLGPDRDRYARGGFYLDAALAYKLSKHAKLVLGGVNLLNRARKSFAGDYTRLKEWESTGIDLSLGLQWKY